MYSYEDRMRAVELYIKLGKRVGPTIRQLGYPTKNALKGWHREFEHRLDLPMRYARREPKYSLEQKQAAVKQYIALDRARQESRRLAQQFETDSKKTAKALTDAIEKARELDARGVALQMENAGLSKELQFAREEVKVLQAKYVERNNDMFAVLNELKDRLPASSTGGSQSPPRKARHKRI